MNLSPLNTFVSNNADISAVNFIVSWQWFALVTNSLILSSFVSHIQMTSSIYLFQTSDLILLLLIMPFSLFAMKIFAKATVIFVTVAVPWVCR